MTSPIDFEVIHFEVIPRELPPYLASEQVEEVAVGVAARNLELLLTFSSKIYPRARLLVDAERKLMLDENRSLWGSSWSPEQKKEVLKVVAASFYALRKAAANHRSHNFNVAEVKEEAALQGVHELASVIDRYWRDQERANDALALVEALQQLEEKSGNSSIAALDEGTFPARSNPVGNGGGYDVEPIRSSYEPMEEANGEPPSQSPQTAFWSCLNRVLPPFRSCSPCCCPPWCVKWLKPSAAME